MWKLSLKKSKFKIYFNSLRVISDRQFENIINEKIAVYLPEIERLENSKINILKDKDLFLYLNGIY